MEVETTLLSGLKVLRPTVYSDGRGFFLESYNEALFRENGIDIHWRQDNHASSRKNTLRGLHFQKGNNGGQVKLVRCSRGILWDVAVDIRPNSPTCGKWHAVELSEENKKMLFIPAGFAHGYAVLSDVADCLYKCSSLYDPSLEDGIAWDDPDIGIEWPVTEPILSERDKHNPSFRQYLKSSGK